MIVDVYGVGYLITAGDPYLHWPITLVGLLGKIFSPIGFAFSVVAETLRPDYAELAERFGESRVASVL